MCLAELLAESPVRRRRVAQDSGKTEQQCPSKLWFTSAILPNFEACTTIMTGKPTCSSTIPNASSYEELDGCNAKWINANT
ncbi:signal recognition particle 54 kDa protein, chloroplastic isoform [Sesbania bispinosa]|nr:signal recognition particle 54 kDa protein, chloroplastic isoform [Sesbania bispinosa]